MASTYVQGSKGRARRVSCAWHVAESEDASVTATHNVYIPERGLIWPACNDHAALARPGWKVTDR